MTTIGIQNILKEFDLILEDETNLSTRSGLRLSMSVLREAVTTISDIHKRVEAIERERHAESQKIAEKLEEGKWLRRTTIGAAVAALVMLFINGFLFIISTVPIIELINRQP